MLARGDKVISTARGRSLPKLAELEEKGASTLELDVTAPLSELHAVAAKAVAIYGRIDVVVNNAGYILSGALEENTYVISSVSPLLRLFFASPSPEQTYEQFNTNVFGALNVSRALLPYMRPRKTGTIVWIGSLGGYRLVGYANGDEIENDLIVLFFLPTVVLVEPGSIVLPNTPSGVSPRVSTRRSPPWDFVAWYSNLATSAQTSSRRTTARPMGVLSPITNRSCVRDRRDSLVRGITDLP